MALLLIQGGTLVAHDNLFAAVALLRRRTRTVKSAAGGAGLVVWWLGISGCGEGSQDAATSGADGGADGGAGRGVDAGNAGPSTTESGTGLDTGIARDAAQSVAADGATGGASTEGGGSLCPGLGWCQLSDTRLASVCPDATRFPAIQADEGCSSVIDDWSGGAADTKRNRLIVWGGGHRGYFGNEIYALDLNALAMRRLNDPSDPGSIDTTNCTPPEAYADGRPSSRHTYDGLAYLPDADKMYAFGGAGIPCGYGVRDTWALDLATVESAAPGQPAPWANMNPSTNPTKPQYGIVSDYDPNTKKIIVDDGYNLWSYELGANVYALLNDANGTNAHIDYHMTGRVDPKRELFVVVGGSGSTGGGMQVFDIGTGSSYAQQDWTKQVSNCDALMAAESPGWAYDSVQDRLVGWAGGDTIYVFDPDTKGCTLVSHGGSPGPENANGTFGRFRYFPALRVFALVNDAHTDAYTLRLTP